MKFDGTVTRWRRPRIADPYNPARTVWGEWEDATKAPLEGAWIASTSSSAMRAESRVQILTAKSLYLDDPDADIATGDGISLDPDATAPDYIIEAATRADVNPFSGWQPVREVPLVARTG